MWEQAAGLIAVGFYLGFVVCNLVWIYFTRE